MRITALLSHFNEPPELLYDSICAASKLMLTDIVVADGPYAQFPHGGTIHSSQECKDAIEEAVWYNALNCYTLGVRQFKSEMDKRTQMFQFGWERSHPDWFYILDADEIVVGEPDVSPLIETNSLVADVEFYETTEDHNLPDHIPAEVRRLLTSPTRMRRFFRAGPNIKADKVHSRYIDGEGRVLWTPLTTEEAIGSIPLQVMVDHQRWLRGSERLAQQSQYYGDRNETTE